MPYFFHYVKAVAAITVLSLGAVWGAGLAPLNKSLAAPASAEFTVTTTADLSPCTSSALSLRCAIHMADVNQVPSTIRFRIDGSTPGCDSVSHVCIIRPTAALPPLTATGTTIDGFSQPFAAQDSRPTPDASAAVLTIRLDGSQAGPASSGLDLYGAGIIVRGLIVTGFGHSGIRIDGGSSDNLQGNFVGNDGSASLPNWGSGVEVVNSSKNTIGGTSPGDTNVVSGNNGAGITFSQASGNVVVGNLIGVNDSGARALPNGMLGIGLDNASSNIIGGSTASSRNIVSGNAHGGLLVHSASGITIAGNFIGTDQTGSVAIPNLGPGIQLESVSGNVVGGTASGTGNVISGNKTHGVQMINARDNLVYRNYIGTNSAATSAIPNLGDGIYLRSVNHTVIGGAGSGNVISGNRHHGIEFILSGANTIYHNQIGVSALANTSLGNGGHGIYLHDASASDRAVANMVANNALSGIGVGSSAVDQTHEMLSRNAVYGNHGLGISLFPANKIKCSGLTTGPNNYLPCPRIHAVRTMLVSGTACRHCTVEVYVATNARNDRGHGSGKVYLGSTIAEHGTWTLHIPKGRLRARMRVTATATSRAGVTPAQTSEYSANRYVHK